MGENLAIPVVVVGHVAGLAVSGVLLGSAEKLVLTSSQITNISFGVSINFICKHVTKITKIQPMALHSTS